MLVIKKFVPALKRHRPCGIVLMTLGPALVVLADVYLRRDGGLGMRDALYMTLSLAAVMAGAFWATFGDCQKVSEQR